MLLGSTRDEQAYFYPLFGVDRALSETGFDDRHAALGPDGLQKVKALYDPAVYPLPPNLGNRSRWWWTSMRVDSETVHP